jgi:hypothetical protein
MAIVKNNQLTKALSGRIGNLVFRQRNGKTVVYSLPCAYPPPTANQQIRRHQFAKAVSLAKIAINDEIQRAFFKSIARKGQSVYHAALSYFLKNGNADKINLQTPSSQKFKTDFLPELFPVGHFENIIIIPTINYDAAIKNIWPLGNGFP